MLAAEPDFMLKGASDLVGWSSTWLANLGKNPLSVNRDSVQNDRIAASTWR